MLRDILEVIVGGTVAGIGVTAIFSFALLGTVRASEARREGRGGAGWTSLAVLMGFGVVVSVALGLYAVAG